MRGIILAGGYGTRMLPVTKVTNKHLLPVYTKDGAVPMIHFPIHTLTRSGIENILIISSRQHSGPIIEHLGDGTEFHADFSYKVQDMDTAPIGIAGALQIAENYTNDEPFAVILGDNFFENEFSFIFTSFNNTEIRDAICFFKRVDKPNRFGVIKWDDNGYLKHIVEKPSNPPSDCAVTGLYLFKQNVYKLAKDLEPSHRGELEIVDILNRYNTSRDMTSRLGTVQVGGFWSDMGTPEAIRNTQEFLNETQELSKEDCNGLIGPHGFAPVPSG